VPDPAPTLAEHIEHILDAARIAPSHDNVQPWRFVVEGELVSFLVDVERDRTPADAAGRVARIGVGAALECALLRAGRMGATVKFVAPRPGALVTLSITSPKRMPEADKALLRRVTNRRPYDGRPIDDATLTWLQQATPPLLGARTLWFGRERVRILGPIVGEGEALYYRDAPTREASVRALRFDVRDTEEVPLGLSVGCLELTPPERLAVDAFRRTPQDRLESTGAFDRMGAYARRLVESASGLCIVATPGTDAMSDVVVGRCMQRAWLALTRKGLVAHPMNAIPTIEARLALDESAAPPFGDADRARAVVASFRAAFPNVEKASRVALLLRVGQAAPPSTRTRRLPLSDSVAVAAPLDESPPSIAPPPSLPATSIAPPRPDPSDPPTQ
jgi:nitroreductase